MYHFQNSLNLKYKTLHMTIIQNILEWDNYELQIKNFNKWRKIFISYLLIWISPNWKMFLLPFKREEMSSICSIYGSWFFYPKLTLPWI
jgi:hypothetical protein